MTDGLECVFCAILAGRAEASVVYEDPSTLAFLDINPMVPGHTLVIPKTHRPNLAGLDSAQMAALIQVGNRIASAMRLSALRCEGVNLFLADGAAAGQEVMHVHLHVIPRFAGDGFGLRLPPGYGRQSRRVLEQQAQLLRHVLEDETSGGIHKGP